MTSLPTPETYEAEYTYWPWSKAIDLAAELVADNAVQGATVVDYMCGTGHLLRALSTMRKDLVLIGVDQNEKYIQYARQAAPDLEFHVQSLPGFQFRGLADIAVCTAGIHHLPPDSRQAFLTSVRAGLSADGILIVGEEVISDYSDEQSRRRAVINLWCPLLDAIVLADAPSDVLEAAVMVMRSDLLLDGEYKLTLDSLGSLVDRHFRLQETRWTWQAPGLLAGDVVLLCKVA